MDNNRNHCGYFSCNSLFSFIIWLFFTVFSSSATADNIYLGDRFIYLKCSGKGSPAVILESGFRNDSDVWTVPAKGTQSIFSWIAQFTRVCVYDRPGTVGWQASKHSRSSPIAMPRTAEQVVTDLHNLLNKAQIKGPYVLVGHSLGGLFVRLYASTYPKDVAGLVLIDAFSEYIRTELGPKNWEAYKSYIMSIPPELSNYKGLETIDFDAAATLTSQAVAKNPFKNKPVIVISRGQAPGLPTDFPISSKQLEDAWHQSQLDLAQLNPDEPLIIAKHSQHYIQVTEPKLIVRAVRNIVQNIRKQ